MRIGPYFWQLIHWGIFLQITLVTLLPIRKNNIGNIASDNPAYRNTANGIFNSRSNDKDLIHSEKRCKRQIDDSDDEFKPRPSDFAKEDAHIESQPFFYPVLKSSSDEAKPDSSTSRTNLMNAYFERVMKPDENVQIPLYDDDIDSNPDPLRGILDAKYWEEENDHTSKMNDFFLRTPMSRMYGMKNKDDEENDLETKDVNFGNTCGKGNLQENGHLREDKASCYGNPNVPMHFLNKIKSDNRQYKYKKMDENKQFLKKDDLKLKGASKRKFGKKEGKSATDEENKDVTVLLDRGKCDENNQHGESLVKSSQIPAQLVSNLGNVINNIVNDVVTGALENSKESDNKTIEEVENANTVVPVADYFSLAEEIDDINGFRSLSDTRRHLLSFNEEEEHSLDKPNASGGDGDGYGRESYLVNEEFSALSNIRRHLLSFNEEEEHSLDKPNASGGDGDGYGRESYLVNEEFSALSNIRRHLLSFNEEEEHSLDKLNASGGRGYHKKTYFNDTGFSYLSNFIKRHLLSFNEDEEYSLDQTNANKGDAYSRENYFSVDSNMDSFNHEQKYKESHLNFLKNAIRGVTKQSNDMLQDTSPMKSEMNEFVDKFNLSDIENSNRNMLNPPIGLNPVKGRRRQVNAHTPSEAMLFIQPRSNLLNTDERLKSKVLLKDTTIGIGDMSTTNQYPTGSSSLPTSTVATSSESLSVVSRQRNFTDVSGNETTTRSMNDTNNATDIPVDDEDEQLNIDISNKVVDAIFAQANAHGSMRNTLGICRKSGDLKTIKGSKVVENKGESVVEDIMKCVNTILKSHAEKQMCLMLDDDLHDFLKWLLLSGEPMHGKSFVPEKPERDKSEFLFPSMCSDTAPEQTKKPESASSKISRSF